MIELLGLVEIPEIIKVATTLIPGLATVPILGKIIPLLSSGTMDEFKAFEQYEAEKEKSTARRTKLKKENNRYVIKVSEAMTCVEVQLDGKLSLAFLKAAIKTILGGKGNAFDTLFDPIAQCMVEKALQQKNARSIGKYVKTKNTPEPFSEIINLRRGKLHPFIPE
jgi:hypothetical protein